MALSASPKIRNTQVYIRQRFLGWANFFFDTGSPFFGMSRRALAHDDRGEADRSRMPNWRLAINEFLYNSEWQHLDVWNKLLQTIVMAFVGTLFAAVLAFPLSFIAARNITPSAPQLADEARLRLPALGRHADLGAVLRARLRPRPDPGHRRDLLHRYRHAGQDQHRGAGKYRRPAARGHQVGRRASSRAPLRRRAPGPAGVFSQALYFWESNTRSATIIGAVGAGGIGLKLIEAMRTNQDWENVAYMVLLILIVVFVFDNISNALRSRLIGGSQR